MCGCLTRLARPGWMEPAIHWADRIQYHYQDSRDCRRLHQEITAYLWKKK